MTALTLQDLSGGRLLLGLGVSGAQVVEGWHGVPFRSPLAATRDYVAILRQMLAADTKVEYQGEVYSVPYKGSDGTGAGRPLRSTMPAAPDTPILIAALGPRNTALAAEIGDGLLPYLWSPQHWEHAWGEALAAAPDGFQVAPTVIAALGDDLAACRDKVRPRIALHVGGMGSKDKNFYKALVVAVRLRRGSRAHPGPVPVGRSGRGRRRSERSARRRPHAGRSTRSRRRATERLAAEPDQHAHRRAGRRGRNRSDRRVVVMTAPSTGLT